MVNNETLKKISTELSELCERHGVASNLDVRNSMDNECVVSIPKEIANEKDEALSEIARDLGKLDCIDDVYDRGAGRTIRGDDYRQFEISVKDGCWTHTKADDEALERTMEELMDKTGASNQEKKLQKIRSDNWIDYLLPTPKPDGSRNTEIFLTMAYEPYDWIDKGFMENGKHQYKDFECRAYNEYYNKKLLSHPIKTVKFQRGYGGPGRPKPEQMRFEVKNIRIWDSVNDIECDPRDPTPGIVPQFFVINLGNRL